MTQLTKAEQGHNARILKFINILSDMQDDAVISLNDAAYNQRWLYEIAKALSPDQLSYLLDRIEATRDVMTDLTKAIVCNAEDGQVSLQYIADELEAAQNELNK